MTSKALPGPHIWISNVVLCATFSVILSSVASGQSPFTLVQVPGATPIASVGINNHGQLAGAIGPPGGPSQVMLWNRTTPPQTITIGASSFATAISDSGQIVGGAGDVFLPQAFLWDPNTGVQQLESLGADESIATAINNSGAVVGYNYFSQIGTAFQWTQANGMQDFLPQITAGSFAMTINLSGLVAGFYVPNGGSGWNGFAWSQPDGLQDLGTLGGTRTFAYAMNDAGTVVGGSELTGGNFLNSHAFSWTRSSGMVDLGTLGGATSVALGINNHGWIVGSSTNSHRQQGPIPFLWTPGGGMQDLRKGLLPLAHAILGDASVNDFGVIALSTDKGLYVLFPLMRTTLTSTPNPSRVGQPVTLTAAVNSIAGTPPDGELVQFKQGTKLLGTAPLQNGVAQLTTSKIPAGSHHVAATYTGDANYFPSKSLPLTQVVNP